MQYDSALGRFYSIDALAERSFDVTPYHYGLNNPVYWADYRAYIRAFLEQHLEQFS